MPSLLHHSKGHDLSDFSDVLKRMGRILGDNRYLSLKLGDTFELRTAAMEKGAVSVTVDSTAPGRCHAGCVVNVDYLSAALSVLPGKTVRLRPVGDGLGPLLLETPENSNVTLAIMPVRL